MRLRDLRWYILACVIIIVSYAAIAVCYYLPVRGKAEESMKVLGLEATKEEAILAVDQVNAKYDHFLLDDSGYELAQASTKDTKYVFPSDGLHQQFESMNFKSDERRILIAKASEILAPDAMPSDKVADNNYYFFFEKLGSPNKFTRIPVKDFFTGAGYNLLAQIGNKDSNGNEISNPYALLVANSSESILFDGTGNDQSSTNVLLGFSLDLEDGNSYYNESNIQLPFLDSQTNENVRVNGVLSFSALDVKCFTNTAKAEYTYVGIFINLQNEYLAIDWVVSQAFIFYTIGVLVVVAMLVILVLGCRKASVLLRVDRHGLQSTKAVVIRVDGSGKVIFTNKVFKQLFGITKLHDVSEFIDVHTNTNIMNTIKKNDAFECSVPHGEDFIYLHLSPLHISRSYYLMGTDVTIDYLRRRHLEDMCGKNENTGCENGFSLRNNFQHILADSSLDVAFVEFNIHHPEELMTVYGRTNYNTILCEYLNSLREVYEGYQLFHLDDSKFMAVVPNESLTMVADLAEKILDKLRRPIVIRQNNVYVKSKIIAYNVKREDFGTIDLDTIKLKQELAFRNIAEYQNKDYIVYDPAMDNLIEAADEMEKDLERGLIDKEFKMYLQPQFDVVMNKINGFEALIRWINPKYRDKSPQAFIELAEQRGHMLDIGRFVISESFKLAKKLEPYNIHISINVSPVQLLQVAFVQQLTDEFKANKLKKGSVAIEITETFLMGNFQLVTEKLKFLKDMGFHIHLDDFCTGYSSMLYLKDLPVDTIKIDKEFTKYVETSKVHANIVKTICSLATSLDLELICEGVESQAQAEAVKKMGCRTIQGYLIGKAVPYEEALELLKKYNG